MYNVVMDSHSALELTLIDADMPHIDSKMPCTSVMLSMELIAKLTYSIGIKRLNHL